MKIVHVTPYYSPAAEWGGPVRSVAMLAEATLRAGAEVEVVTTNARGAAHLPQEPPVTQDVAGVPVTYCQAHGPPRRFFFSPELAPELRRRLSGADVVHIHGIFTYPVVAAARLCERHDVPYVVSPRGSLDPWALRQKRLKKAAYMLLLERRTLLRAALLHFTAEDERRTAPAQFRGRPYAVVPNCLELEPLLGLERAEAEAPVPEVLILGRIHVMKGFDVLIPAVRRLVDAGSPLRLVVAGNDEGGYRAKVEQLVSKHRLEGCVSFLGEVSGERKELALRRASLLVAPSYRENFGMAIAEAMAAGLPVVVSDRVGIGPDIAECGAGLIVRVESRAVAGALARLLSEPALRVAMGRRGREMVRARYSGPALAQAMLAAYERVSCS
jgi:glycosyltransferase involved in cell wall biosynthesis